MHWRIDGRDRVRGARRRVVVGGGPGHVAKQADNVCRSLRARRQHRYARADHRPEAFDGSGPAGRRREQAGRGRQHRLRLRGESEAGRLYDPRRDDQLACDQSERLSQDAVRRGQVVRARDPDRKRSAGAGHRRQHAIQDGAGRDCGVKGEARVAFVRVGRQRHVAASSPASSSRLQRPPTSRTCLTRAAVRRSPTWWLATCP